MCLAKQRRHTPHDSSVGVEIQFCHGDCHVLPHDSSVWEEIQFCHGDCHVLGQATEMKFQTKRPCMYLEKAVEEADEEWSRHKMKKLIPTSGNLRQAIPGDLCLLPCMLVIDDESKFSAGFELNVTRGVLGLPGAGMHRRPRH